MMIQQENIVALDIPRPLSQGGRTLGAILIDEGRLSIENAEAVLRLQKDEGMRFGDAALKLGFITEADLQHALSRQFDFPYLHGGESNISPEVIAAYDPFGKQSEELRALRTQLLLRWFGDKSSGKCLAITSPAPREGRSCLAANLSVVFSQLGERTLLIDANLRAPRQHQLFGIDAGTGLSAILTGRVDQVVPSGVPGFSQLSILTAGNIPPNPQELLARPGFAELLRTLKERYDVILIDTPCARSWADAQTIASRAGGAIALTRRHHTRVAEMNGLVDSLRRSGSVVVGSLMVCF